MVGDSFIAGRWRIEVAERPAELTACNCSLCRRLGTLSAYYRPQQVSIVRGAGTTVPYGQVDRTLAVHRCATCGCITHWSSLTGADRMAVNARLMEKREIEGVRVRRLDGAVTWNYLD